MKNQPQNPELRHYPEISYIKQHVFFLGDTVQLDKALKI